MSKLALVASAMSSIIGYPVKIYDECVANGLTISPAQILDLDSIHKYSLIRNDGSIHDVEDSIYRNPVVRAIPTPTQDISASSNANSIQIFVRTLVGHSQAMFVNPHDTVLEFKDAIRTKLGLDNRQMRLIFSGKQLNDSETLATYNIQRGDTVHILFRLRGGFDFYVIGEEFLDPQFDYDFTNRKDEGQTYVRGKLLYKRPYGWERIALNVSGKYGSDYRWLGHVGNSSDEWPVSYHGTYKSVANNIANEGYLLSKGKRFLYGHGIYSSPEIEVAEGYAGTFYHKGDYYKVVFQNRVNPVGLEKLDDIKYWITPNDKNTRPYGLCIKKV